MSEIRRSEADRNSEAQERDMVFYYDDPDLSDDEVFVNRGSAPRNVIFLNGPKIVSE